MTDTETKQVIKCNSEVQAILKKYGCELYLQSEYNRILILDPIREVAVSEGGAIVDLED